MNKNKFLLTIFAIGTVIFASIALTLYQENKSSQLPYTIGTPVLPTSQLPAGMMMKEFTVSANEASPTVSFTITKDTMGGWDVHVTTTNFSFTPEHLDGTPVAGEGHVHLYIDDKLIIMLGPWYHIDSLTPGSHLIKVGLFNNDHSIYTVHGNHIETQQTISVGAASMSM